ncbi:MAG: DUF2231 domain-containing protein [Stackebrandtia sp.]
MPSELYGLPLHPLTVHAPVVLVPLLTLLVLVYVLAPPLRRHVGWVVMALTVAVPASVYGARLTGELLAEDSGGMTDVIAAHADKSVPLLWLTIALAPVTWFFGLLERGRRTVLARRVEAPKPAPVEGEDGTTSTPPSADDDPAVKGRRLIMAVLGLAMLGLAGASAYYVFQAGDSGARMVWG